MEAYIRSEFESIFCEKPQIYVFAPGRINLIGEHVDYNGGFVMPAAINLGISFSMSRSTDCLEFHSLDLKSSVTVSIDNLNILEENRWANYFLGVVNQMRLRGYEVGGLKVVFGGSIPIGSGLSSSAALECGFGMGVSELYGLNIDRKEMAHIGQMAEHTYAGVKCGIMDQFASLFGSKDQFIQLNCISLEYEYHSWKSDKYKLILIDSKVKHSLADSAYNERRNQCEEGLQMLNRAFKKSYPELSFFTLDQIKQLEGISSDDVYNRVCYVIEEIERVKKTSELLDQANIQDVGVLLFESHTGLSRKYEVSCDELDFLVNYARKKEGFIGARMMGGGFGGCTINIVERNMSDAWKDELEHLYFDRFTNKPAFYEFEISEGVTVQV